MTNELRGEYLDFAKQLAYDAGEIMRKYFLNTEREWKEDQTPLTIADTTINRLVVERIAEKFPEHSVLGEEESSAKNGRYTWVCDPVDGTMPYSHGLPISTFSLALCDNGRPIVGVVYDPFIDRLFWAEKDGGAFCNTTQIQVSDTGLNYAAIDIEGLGNPNPVVNMSNTIRDTLIAKGAKIMHLWSAILPAVLVASGEWTAVIMNGSTIQDAPAVKIIVEEAGGRVTDLFGNDQRYDKLSRGFIASNGVVHDELVRIVREAAQ